MPFSRLRQVFLDIYMIIFKRQYTPNNLAFIKQNPDESLSYYISKFNNEYAKCIGCDEVMTHNAFMGGFVGDNLYFYLTQNPLTPLRICCVRQLNKMTASK